MEKIQEQKPHEVLAISASDFITYGCVKCGYIHGGSIVNGRNAVVWNCDKCGSKTVVVADGLSKSPINVGGASCDTLKVTKHPKNN